MQPPENTAEIDAADGCGRGPGLPTVRSFDIGLSNASQPRPGWLRTCGILARRRLLGRTAESANVPLATQRRTPPPSARRARVRGVRRLRQPDPVRVPSTNRSTAALQAFSHIPYLRLGVASRADWVANILLYMPLAFLLAGAAASARSRAARIAGTVAAIAFCVALAFAIEFAQLFFPPRTVSKNDLIAETIGTGLGVTLWFALGSRIRGLVGHVQLGGPRATRAALILYVIAYLAFSLFPYDFLISGKELAAKLGEPGRSAWVLSDSCGGIVRCSAKLFAEILLAAPLGMLFGMLRGRDRPARYRRVLLWGLALGAAIEGLQIFLASGVSQGLSVLTRGLGAVWGLAFQRVFDRRVVRRASRDARQARVVRRAGVSRAGARRERAPAPVARCAVGGDREAQVAELPPLLLPLLHDRDRGDAEPAAQRGPLRAGRSARLDQHGARSGRAPRDGSRRSPARASGSRSRR